jgi:hypothetical protein
MTAIRSVTRIRVVAALLLAACSDAVDPGPKPQIELSATFSIVVTDSLDQALGGAFVSGQGWVGTAPIQLELPESFRADSLGRATFLWPATEPVDYDSITFDVAERPCRPYAAGQFAFDAPSLQGLKGDSLYARLPVGLAVASPELGVGAKVCAGAEKDFGAYQLWLAIESWPATPGDSVRAQWDIYFRETSALAVHGAAGIVRSDSLLMYLRINEPYRCTPGYFLRARLDEGRLGEAALEALNQSDPLCAPIVRPIHALRFVPLEVDWWP